MNPLPLGLLAVSALLTSVLFVAPSAEAATVPAVKFGMDAPGVDAQKAAGVKPDYATMWIGPWTLSSGWGGPDDTMASLKSAGVTPAIHFYYWGDDITPTCVEKGCWSSLHKTQKDRAHWRMLGDQLASHLNSKMQGAPVVVFLESEFNKAGISTYEPFDGYLADMAYRLKGAYPGATIVLGFGNWQSGDWGIFDRAAAASQMVGLQAMKGSTKDPASSYNGLYDATLAGVRRLAGLFHKPIMLTDVALSSYPEPGYVTMQRDNLQKFFVGLPALKDAGVKAVLYRSWGDSPEKSTANYYGEAERHFGVAYASGSHKSAARVWIDGVKAVRAGTTAAPAPAPAPAPTASSTSSGSTSFSASFTPRSVGNDYWVEAQVTSSSAIAKVEARLGSGPWTVLPRTSWGNYADDLHAPNGTQVVFRATSTSGATATSLGYTWT
ncbi:MAG TPA: hypothetical protein VM327_05260 [Candidatus Thermoplasmatota archaeon]|nr:hypothetical protein [Candidatus Thermoplasmatota archaeon]